MHTHRLLAVSAVVALATGVLPAAMVSSARAAGEDPKYHRAPAFRPTGPRVRVRPRHYSAVQVDLGLLRRTLRAAPGTASRRAPLVFTVPTPSGGTERFAVRRTTVMEPRLAAAHPEIATYAGRSLDHPATTVALDVTPMGFHAAVRGPQGQGAWYVDPATNARGTRTHLSYFGGAVPAAVHRFAEKQLREIRSTTARRGAARSGGRASLVKQRIYRLALTSDPSYAAYFGSANVIAEKVTLINRVNQIYNDDLAISLRLVNATDRLNLDTNAKATGPNGPCGAHPCFDPGTASTPSQLAFCDEPGLARNRTVLGQLVGASNYDIGHLALGVDGGGVAELGVVGQDFKGGGCTGLTQPQGDFYAIDYVAHEMGHQFDANHTFDGVLANCSGGNRNAETSVEPGSGTSVMAYAGICAQDDLQPHSDPYFSQRSIDEVSSYTTTRLAKVVEVQTVSLRGFDTNGDHLTLGYRNHRPVTITRGVDYSTAGIEAAVEKLTGKNVTIAQWAYDPFATATYPTPTKEPDDTGFQVIFASTAALEAPGPHRNLRSLKVSSSTPGVSGFVGETAKGGRADNRGHQVVTTHNHAPDVVAPADRTLPVRTPFTLRASGGDRDGDPVTYLWEQNDPGASPSSPTDDGGTSLVDNTKTDGPLFRVFGTAANVTDAGTLESPSPGENLADGSLHRTFPDIAQILSGNTNALTGTCPAPPPDATDPVPAATRDCFSEFLPTKDYVGTVHAARPALHFRVTARDGYPNGGGTAHDDVKLTLDRDAGPLLVTSQASPTTLQGGRRTTVSWAVNHTDRLAAKVRILLSTDEGATWRRIGPRSTANDGVQRVRLPRAKAQHARIEVQAVHNYFFAVNDADFRIG